MPSEIIAAIIAAIAIIVAAFITKNKSWNSNKQFKISNGITIKKSANFVGEINELFYKAQQEIIIIGGAMLRMTASDSILNNISKNKNVKVRLLALNIEKEEILIAYNKLTNKHEGGTVNLNHLKRFKSNSNIEIRTYEILPTAYFIAIDINTPNGFIKAAHIFSGGSDIDYPNIEISRSNEEWYEIYRHQIENLWGEGTLWEPD